MISSTEELIETLRELINTELDDAEASRLVGETALDLECGDKRWILDVSEV